KTKIQKSKQLLQSLSEYFDINVPNTNNMTEGNYAHAYFSEIAKITKQFGYEFRGRNVEHTQKHNMHSGDIVNSSLNFAYAVLEAYVMKSINAIGLQNDLPYLHEVRSGKNGLVYDMMELWRSNCDYAVILCLEEIKKQHLKWKVENYEVRLGEDIIKVLIEKLKLTLSMQEIIHNTRILARYLLGKTNKLRFELLPIKVDRQDTVFTKEQILNHTARQLGLNKSSHFYIRKRLLNNGTVRLYSKTAKQLS
ncbi:MAG: CRISPR-associated endonuclease Cas1, partial [archaeon]|nr:CRISPR-associated endonuclease Cas1 [archaeon]